MSCSGSGKPKSHLASAKDEEILSKLSSPFPAVGYVALCCRERAKFGPFFSPRVWFNDLGRKVEI